MRKTALIATAVVAAAALAACSSSGSGGGSGTTSSSAPVTLTLWHKYDLDPSARLLGAADAARRAPRRAPRRRRDGGTTPSAKKEISMQCAHGARAAVGDRCAQGSLNGCAPGCLGDRLGAEAHVQRHDLGVLPAPAAHRARDLGALLAVVANSRRACGIRGELAERRFQ